MNHEEIHTLWRFKPTLRVETSYNVLVEILTKHNNKQCHQFYKDLEEFSMTANGDRTHRGQQVTNIYGDPYTWSWYTSPQGHGSLHVWNSTGNTQIALVSFPDNLSEKERRGLVNGVVKRMEEFSVGYIHCSDCGEKIKYHDETGGRYFAGIYCQKCWDGKWKAIEAKENYN